MIDIVTIAEALLEKTRSKEVEWTVGGPREFVVHFLSGRVLVGKDNDNDVYITVTDTNGIIVESANMGFRRYANNREFRNQMVELYDLARRSALRVDSTMESILGEIVG